MAKAKPIVKPVNVDDIKKILVIRFSTFGDVFISTSVCETLKKHFHQSTLHYLVATPFEEAIAGNPFIDNIITFHYDNKILNRMKLIKQIRDMKFDLVIDYQISMLAKQISFFSGAKYTVGYTSRDYPYTKPFRVKRIPCRYSGIEKFDLLELLGVEETPFKYHYNVKSESEKYIQNWLDEVGLNDKEFVLISPGSPNPNKKWQTKNFAILGDLIHNNLDLSVVIIGSKNENEDKQFVYNSMANKPIIAPEMTIDQIFALLKRTKLLVCNDGGLNHMSCATETMTLAIFGLTCPIRWSPAFVFSHHHHLYKPNFPSHKDNTFGITPDEAIIKIKDILQIK